MGGYDFARAGRESYLHEAKAAAERNIARMHRECGEELDDEEISRQLLSIEDSRPFKYSLASVMDEDATPVLGGHPPRRPPSSHHEELAPLFIDWCDRAVYVEGGIKSEKLPSMFRFALRRPLMPESTLQKTLNELGINPTLSFLSDMRVKHTIPHGRIRRTMYGLDPDPTHHVSSKYRNIFPKGLSLLGDESQELELEVINWLGISKRAQVCGMGTAWELGPRRHNLELNKCQLHECLWSLYDLIQDGLVDFEEAPGRYWAVLGKPDLSNFDLTLCLKAFDLPTHHVQNAGIIKSEIPDPDVEEKRIIQEITNLVDLHISGGFCVTEVLALIKEALAGLPFDVSSLYHVIQDHSGDAASVAEQIWEETAGRDPGAGQNPNAVNDHDAPSQPVSAEFEEICDNVLGADLTADDGVAMLKAATDEVELSNAQKSHIISKLDSSRIIAYRRILETNGDEIEASGNPHRTIWMPKLTVEEDFQLFPDGLSQDFQASGLRISSSVQSSQDLSHTLPLENENAVTLGIQGHSKEHHASSISKNATDAATEDTSLRTTHFNALDKRTHIVPFTDSVGHISRRPLNIRRNTTFIMPPPASTTPVTQPTEKPPNTSKSVPECPRTPIPVTEKLDLERVADGAWKPYVSDDDIYDIRDLSSSPEKGTTSDLFGLTMPTSKARELGAKIGLPTDYIHNQIHSKTPRRVSSKKYSKASGNVTFPSRKRKASSMLDSSPCDKAPKHGAFSDLFAQDDEDHEKFVHDHFTWEVLQDSKHCCLRCRRLRCACRKRKRSSGFQEARDRKRSSSSTPVPNMQPAGTKRLLSDSSSSFKSSLSSSSLGIFEDGNPEVNRIPATRIKPAKLRLNPPKPSDEQDPANLPSRPFCSSPPISPKAPSLPELSSSPSLPSSLDLSGSPSPPSSLSRSSPQSSPSPSRLTNRLRPPKALLSDLKREMADLDIMDTLKRFLTADTPEGTLYQLVNHALHLISEQLRSKGPKFSDSNDRSCEQPNQTLRHLIEAELLVKRRIGGSSQQYPNTSIGDPNGRQKTSGPFRKSSILNLPKARSRFRGSRLSSIGPTSQLDDSSSFNAQLGNASGNVAVHSKIVHSVENHIVSDSRPIAQDKTDPTTSSDIFILKDKEMTRRSRSTRLPANGPQRAPDTTAMRALARDPRTDNVNHQRRGEGFHPWPERGISTKDAIDKAHEEARRQRKGIFLYMAERRLIRPRANQSEFNRFYQGGSSSKPSGGAGITSSLNKLFDKYRGVAATCVCVNYQILTRDK